MHKWKRVDTDDGLRFRSTLALHESALLRNLVGSVVGILDAREASTPPDELEAITGMKTGNAQPPEDDTTRRLLPDFYRAEDRPGADEVDADDLRGTRDTGCHGDDVALS